tara:strand:- start:545 stop:1837 length:1293 start_codon:yes stop_codon:yes gene_type:complete
MSSKKLLYLFDIKYPKSESWDKTKTYVEFELNNVHYSMVNSIRRTILSKVKTVGFRTEPYEANQIKIIKNNTPLHNQLLTHRISMIPINFKKPEEYDEDEYLYSIDVTNNTNSILHITSKDFKIKRISTNKYLSNDEVNKLFPPDPITGDYLLITILKPKHYLNLSNSKLKDEIDKHIEKEVENTVSLHFEGKATVSNGSENGHFSPVSCVAYINKVDKDLAKIKEDEYVNKQNQITQTNNLTDYPEETLRNRFNISEKSNYFHTNDKGDPNKFIFKVETLGTIPPLIIFDKAINILASSISNFSSNLLTKNSNYIEISLSSTIKDGYDIKVFEEDDTLGNVVQCYLNELYCDYTLPKDKKLLNYIGYKKPHPLDKMIMFTVQSIGRDIDKITEDIIIPGCEIIIKTLKNIQKQLHQHKEFISEAKSLNQ